jgi:hypothetical protein
MLAPRAALRFVVLVAAFVAISGCTSTGPTSPTSPTVISRARAIDIARQQVTFTPTSIDIATDTVKGHATWAVTFRASDGSHGGLGQFMKVWVDQNTGEIVSLARS